jgi:hypothetical protein
VAVPGALGTADHRQKPAGGKTPVAVLPVLGGETLLDLDDTTLDALVDNGFRVGPTGPATLTGGGRILFPIVGGKVVVAPARPGLYDKSLGGGADRIVDALIGHTGGIRLVRRGGEYDERTRVVLRRYVVHLGGDVVYGQFVRDGKRPRWLPLFDIEPYEPRAEAERGMTPSRGLLPLVRLDLTRKAARALNRAFPPPVVLRAAGGADQGIFGDDTVIGVAEVRPDVFVPRLGGPAPDGDAPAR